MAEARKDMYHETFLREFAVKVKQEYPLFDIEGFVSAVLGQGWEQLELKGRIRRVTTSLGHTLPADFEQAVNILDGIAEDCYGFPYVFFLDYIEVYGLDHWELSMRALERFTRMSTAEFAVRPFLKRNQERMMAQMLEWTSHPDEHVRRLASEGCRPRLPWADALPALKKDPAPILPILQQLKADPSEYVRRSVANNLNDISKDHPELVLATAREWKGSNERTDWVIRHACRGLIRAANTKAMELFGLTAQPDIRVEQWTITPDQIPMGESVEFRYALRVPEGQPMKLRIELAVSFPRQAGRYYRKLFKLSEKEVPGGKLLTGGRRFSFADLSTRRHYPGAHRLALIVNGQELAQTEVLLVQEERRHKRIAEGGTGP
ncbi:DNA alkylation repair protein [Cohnella kolymensis]|uniref:DNA alkylation repair protein n=1 Tax=Cohnella kolymensis TaxID=1590652 RepID=UPI0006960444|nr:DNA alkylation repair protein [Cohnella kolymensis]